MATAHMTTGKRTTKRHLIVWPVDVVIQSLRWVSSVFAIVEDVKRDARKAYGKQFDIYRD